MAIIGVDIGTQSLKVVVCGDDLDVLGEAAGSYPVSQPRPGWAEQDARDWENALGPAIAAALAQAGIPAERVRAIGVSGQLDGCLGVDARGAAVTPCLIWFDRRATDELPASITGDHASAFLRTTGLVADASHMAAKMRWLLRHHESGRDSSPAPARFHQPVSYLVERLTGAYVFDHGLASTTMLYHLETRELASDLLERFELDRAHLPAIAHATEQAGILSREGAALTGLVPGTPVAVGTGDDFATPLGAGLVAPGPMACVLGTAEVVGALSERLVLDERGLVETHCYANDCLFIENPGWLAGGAMAWLRQLVGCDDFATLDAEASAVPPGADGVLFLPALSGAMAPEWIAEARGCFYGLSAAHHRGHLARAVMEGCAHAMRDVGDRLIELGVPVDSILLLGGGARSRSWGQIRADVMGLPVAVATRVDTCPIGAAMLAAVAAGLAPDLASCAAKVVGERTTVEPDPKRQAIHRASYERYRLLFDQLRPLHG